MEAIEIGTAWVALAGMSTLRSFIDHMHKIEALERRDTGLVETLVREQSMRLS